ncbi:hypothetical protein [Mesorhizobium abyssinicae]|uniref:hypothetical protein n=1 Tax=Mesorhizobium abyssinicae TaxID=1209958 RepID=UPI00339432E3
MTTRVQTPSSSAPSRRRAGPSRKPDGDQLVLIGLFAVAAEIRPAEGDAAHAAPSEQRADELGAAPGRSVERLEKFVGVEETEIAIALQQRPPIKVRIGAPLRL